MPANTSGESAAFDRAQWECLRGALLDARFEVEDLLQPDRGGFWLRARDTVESIDVLLFVEPEDEAANSNHLNRFREAAFLSHPSLVRVLAAGRAECEGRRLIYLATETAEADLAEEMQRRPLTDAEAADLMRQLASGLLYLHSENLTSCAVRAGAIWRVNGQWKLADYSQLRVPGQYPVSETRNLLLTPAFECPPEANEGIVSPAWDVWCAGSVLRKVFARNVPPAFAPIVSGALDPDPASRMTVEALLQEVASLPAFDTVETRDLRSLEPDSDATLAPPEPPSFRQPPVRRRGFGVTRTQVILGVILAAAVAGIIALVLPGRAAPVHPDAVHTSAPTVAPMPAVAPVPTSAPALTTAPQSAAQSEQPPVHNPFGDTAASAPLPQQTQKQISAVLNRWADAKRHRNLDEEIACYAPSVDRFYGQRSLPAVQLRREEQNVYARIGAVREFEISNLRFNRVDPESAVVSFDKKWDFEGRSRFSGFSREELVMRSVRGQWRIASEREVKVYWASKEPM